HMAKKFADEGADVVITGRNEERLQQTKTELEQTATGRLLTVSMNVRKPDDVKRTVQRTVEVFGTIDHLVNNAAGNFIVAAEELTVNGWYAVIDIVLNGTFYMSQAVEKYWIDQEKKGTILNIVTTYSWNEGDGVVHKSAATAGVLTLVSTCAVK